MPIPKNSPSTELTFQAWGKDRSKLFANAAEGMFSIITGGKTHNKAGMGFLVYKKVKVAYLKEKIACSSNNVENLLITWLSALIHAYQKREILFQDFDIQKLTETEIESSCYGPLIDDVAELKIKIDSFSFEKLSIEKQANGKLEANISLVC